MKEIWKDIHDYKGSYQVSNFGRVKSLDRFVNGNGGSIYCRKGKIMAFTVNDHGYRQLRLSKNDLSKFHRIHTLVAEAFISLRPKNKDVNHKNGIKTDNYPTNLEWLTKSENILHAFKNGLRKAKRGSEHYRSKLNEDSIKKIRSELSFKTDNQLSVEYAISRRNINDIRHNKIWKHVYIISNINNCDYH